MKQKDKHFLNREISWLEFNSRVLFQADHPKTPLLEKINFLTIYTSNLDEFVMKRVGGLRNFVASARKKKSIDGRDAKTQLIQIRKRIISDNQKQESILQKTVLELKEVGIELCSWGDLNESEVAYCHNFYQHSLHSVLTPLSVDLSEPFPFISNLSYNIGVCVENPISMEQKISRVKIPRSIHEWILLPISKNKKRLVSTADIITQNLGKLFYGMNIIDSMPFKVTRNTDWKYDDEDAQDLLGAIEESINIRSLLEPIRVECLQEHNPEILGHFLQVLGLNKNDIYFYKETLDYLSLSSLCKLEEAALINTTWKPITTDEFRLDKNIFQIIKDKDHLLHHPYESFKTSVERFIIEASQDRAVLSIRISLYRTEENSPFIRALIIAAERGIQVVCLIELKARFDEKRNIQWARQMEVAGVHVVYGVVGLKTHTKIAMVVRKESDGCLLRYAHIGTGNYNSKTANLYTDLGLLTIDPRLTIEINEVFNYLTGTSLMLDYKHLLVSPINAKSKFLSLIQKQIKQISIGRQGYIFAKMNSLEDPILIEALYEASQNGVVIDLIVRGICCLRPGVKDLSESIRVSSIVGRFLEHSRIYFFADGSGDKWQGDYYIGSADWMQRNMHKRVEVITPIYAPALKAKLSFFLDTTLEDEVKSWSLKADGTYSLKQGNEKTATHSVMMRTALSDHQQISYSSI